MSYYRDLELQLTYARKQLHEAQVQLRHKELALELMMSQYNKEKESAARGWQMADSLHVSIKEQREQAERALKSEQDKSKGYLQALQAWAADMTRAGFLCGQTDDEYPLQAVERMVSEKESTDGAVYSAGRMEGHADVAAMLRKVLDPEDVNHYNLDGLLKEVERLKYQVEPTLQYTQSPTESCIKERANDKGGCGACALCCKEVRDRLEQVEFMLKWYVDNDDTNNTEYNRYWLDNKRKAMKLLGMETE